MGPSPQCMSSGAQTPHNLADQQHQLGAPAEENQYKHCNLQQS